MVLPTGTNWTLDQAVGAVRQYLGDRPENNKIIPGFEVSNDSIKLAIELAIDEFNNTPPFMQFTLATFPSKVVIIHGSIVHCLIMAGIIQSRNYLQFSDGGISEILGDRAQQYQGWIQQISSQVKNYKQSSDEIKIAINMENGWGVAPSPYGYWYSGVLR